MLRRQWLKTLLTGLLAGATVFSVHAQEEFGFAEGEEYKLVPQPQETAPHKKQVTEVFYYGCSHCYHLETGLHEWLKNKPADVHFEQMPAVLNNPNWIFMAKVYYTAKELGVIEQSHMPFFHALHRDRKPLFNVKAIARFFTRFGVKEAEFENTFKSFKVDQLVRQAIRRTNAYGIDGVPALVVNGKYLTDVPMAKSEARMWKVVNYLTHK